MASGNTLAVFKPRDYIPPSSNGATLDTRNTHRVLDFDAATEESVYWESCLHRDYAGGGITVTVWWCASTATSGVVKFGAAFERHLSGTTDLDVDDFAAEQTNTDSPNGTEASIVESFTITFTNGAQMDSLAAGESFRFKLARKAADGADTMAGDAEVLAVELRET